MRNMVDSFLRLIASRPSAVRLSDRDDETSIVRPLPDPTATIDNVAEALIGRCLIRKRTARTPIPH
jgi:hypothetical protein